jgi:hypothetical protein
MQNLDAEEFKTESFIKHELAGDFGENESIELQDIILRLGSEEYLAPDHLKQYTFSEKC